MQFCGNFTRSSVSIHFLTTISMTSGFFKAIEALVARNIAKPRGCRSSSCDGLRIGKKGALAATLQDVTGRLTTAVLVLVILIIVVGLVIFPIVGIDAVVMTMILLFFFFFLLLLLLSLLLLLQLLLFHELSFHNFLEKYSHFCTYKQEVVWIASSLSLDFTPRWNISRLAGKAPVTSTNNPTIKKDVLEQAGKRTLEPVGTICGQVSKTAEEAPDHQNEPKHLEIQIWSLQFEVTIQFDSPSIPQNTERRHPTDPFALLSQRQQDQS